MMWYSIEPKTRKYVKGYGFLSFARKYRKQLLDTGLVAPKIASWKFSVVDKAAESTGEYIRTKISDTSVKPKHVTDENPKKLKK